MHRKRRHSGRDKQSSAVSISTAMHSRVEKDCGTAITAIQPAHEVPECFLCTFAGCKFCGSTDRALQMHKVRCHSGKLQKSKDKDKQRRAVSSSTALVRGSQKFLKQHFTQQVISQQQGQ